MKNLLKQIIIDFHAEPILESATLLAIIFTITLTYRFTSGLHPILSKICYNEITGT